jgi:hypothetical protein
MHLYLPSGYCVVAFSQRLNVIGVFLILICALYRKKSTRTTSEPYCIVDYTKRDILYTDHIMEAKRNEAPEHVQSIDIWIESCTLCT